MSLSLAMALLFVSTGVVSTETPEMRIEKLLKTQKELAAKIQALEEKEAAKTSTEMDAAEMVQLPSRKSRRGAKQEPRKLQDLAEVIGGLTVCLDYMWLLVSGALVMFMQ